MNLSTSLAPSSGSRMRSLSFSRRSVRGLRTAAHVARGLFVPKTTGLAREDPLSRWCRDLLSLLGVELTLSGERPDPGAYLLVSNHISWMDILVIRALFPTRFVAKEEIALWPVIGSSAREAGTLFLGRDRLSSFFDTLHFARTLLEKDLSVCVFPEGTTTSGTHLLPFRTGMFEVCIRSGKPVLPLYLRYVSATCGSSLPVSYTDNESFARSFWRTLGEPRISACVDLLHPITPTGKTRKELARGAWGVIQERALLAVAPGTI